MDIKDIKSYKFNGHSSRAWETPGGAACLNKYLAVLCINYALKVYSVEQMCII